MKLFCCNLKHLSFCFEASSFVHSFVSSFIHSFSTYLLSIYLVPVSCLDVGVTTKKKTGPCPDGVYRVSGQIVYDLMSGNTV